MDEATRGIAPIPEPARGLGFWNFVVLWGDLGVGLLVLLAGSLLVPGLGLRQAFAAIVLGSVIGSALLALAGMPSSATGVPTMVVLRRALGRRGSYVPTAINVVQLVGWTIFELVIMGHAANAASRRLLNVDAYWLWLAVFAVIVVGLGVWGPLAVIRRFLGHFAVWVMVVTTIYITWILLARHDVAGLWGKPGTGGGPGFWAAVDIVIAMPISWMPLCGDYSRFARRPVPAAWGTALGYTVANAWFYALGALILLAANVSQEPKGFVEAIMLLAGPAALLVLLVDETDGAWADLYSSAVSIQNIHPAANQRALILGIGILSFAVALVLDVTQYESFLLLIGSVFVPLFGVLASDFFVLRRRYDARELIERGAVGASPEVRWGAIAAWLAGVVTFQWIAGSLGGLGVPAPPDIGASIPSFGVALVAHVVLASVGDRRAPAPLT